MTGPSQRHRRPAAAVLLIALVPLVAACGPKALQRARTEAQFGNLDTAITYYEEVLDEDPGNVEARVALRQVKSRASQMHQKIGLTERDEGNLERALLEMELAVRLDPANETARHDLVEIERELAEARRAEAEQRTPTELAVEQARAQESPLPRLEPRVTGPIDLDFRAASVRDIYRSLGELGGISVLFDQAIRDDTTDFRVSDVGFDQALSILTASQGHFSKVLGPRTLLILPDDPTTRRQYADQILRTFYLSNADAANVANMLRNLLQARLITENPELNTVTIRDTPELVAVAEKIISANDKPGGEVLLDIEILEVNRSALKEFGTSFSPQLLGNVSIAQEQGGISLQSLGNLTNEDIFVTLPSIRYQLFKQRSDFKLVAQPQLRVTEGQATNLLIGQRVPVINTTFNPTQTTGGDVIPISSTTYEEVGIILAATPRVHHNDEITLELQITVSAIAGISNIQDLPIFSTREITATIRLKDGETNLLAGLLRDDERTSKDGVPYLMDLPVLGNLFSSTREEVEQTDVVMSITPHILRGSEIDEEDLRSVYVGTEAVVGGVGGGVAAVDTQRQALERQRQAAQQEQEPPATMAMLPAEHVVDPGDQFSVDVTLQGARDLFSAGVRLSYNPSVIEFVEAFEGSLLRQGGAETSFQAAPSSNGRVDIGLARIQQDATGVRGSGTLATVVFRAVAPGQTPIEIVSSAARDVRGSPLPVTVTPASVRVREQRPE